MSKGGCQFFLKLGPRIMREMRGWEMGHLLKKLSRRVVFSGNQRVYVYIYICIIYNMKGEKVVPVTYEDNLFILAETSDV